MVDIYKISAGFCQISKFHEVKIRAQKALLLACCPPEGDLPQAKDLILLSGRASGSDLASKDQGFYAGLN
jgi:hypothetical protein